MYSKTVSITFKLQLLYQFNSVIINICEEFGLEFFLTTKPLTCWEYVLLMNSWFYKLYVSGYLSGFNIECTFMLCTHFLIHCFDRASFPWSMFSLHCGSIASVVLGTQIVLALSYTTNPIDANINEFCFQLVSYFQHRPLYV